MVIDNGAYNHHGPAVAGFASMLPAALYRVQAAETQIKLVYTNTQPGSSFRGFANAQITFAMESQLDELPLSEQGQVSACSRKFSPVEASCLKIEFP